MLLKTPEIHKLESRFISLFDRTFLKAIKGKQASKYLKSVKTQFSSATFRVQVDRIIDDLYIHTINYTDSQLTGLISASQIREQNMVKVFASAKPLPLTVEAVKQSVGLSEEITESIIRMLKDEGIYELHPNQLEKRIRDLWGGQKHRAVRFARTFTADVATSTELWRYQDAGIEEMQFYAKIDERTSDQCRMLHGTIFRTDSPEAHRYKVPLHFHCRSDILPCPPSMKIDPKMRYENRDFSKPLDQDFNIIDEKVENEIIEKTFKDIEHFRDEYGIDQFVFDEDIEARLQKLSVQVLSESPTVKNRLVYKPAKTVKEAEKWVLNNTNVKYADMKGLKLEVVNDMNKSLVYHINLEPKTLDEIKYFGSIKGQCEIEYQYNLKEEIKTLIDQFGESQERAEYIAKKRIEKRVFNDRRYAHFWDAKPQGYDFTGIGVSTEWNKDLAKLKESMDYSVSIGFHPPGCNTIKSMIDHEFGHSLDRIYGFNQNKELLEVFNSLTKADIEKGLSTYGTYNIQEFIAESWSEYLNNPAPRKISKQIGDIITNKIESGTK